MVGKYLILSILFLFMAKPALSQSTEQHNGYEIDVETFMGMLDGIFSDSLIDEITYCLPDHLKIYNFAIGDFSGDTLADIAISYKDKTCSSNTLKVILLVNFKTSFIIATERALKWQINPYDISFLIKNHNCIITSRQKEKWIFATYTYKNNSLKQISEEKY
jgi:hypothetical protein